MVAGVSFVGEVLGCLAAVVSDFPISRLRGCFLFEGRIWNQVYVLSRRWLCGGGCGAGRVRRESGFEEAGIVVGRGGRGGVGNPAVVGIFGAAQDSEHG